jgi:hypothetical protein
MTLSIDATFFCPACGCEMENVQRPSADFAIARCKLCGQTWTISTSDECHAILKAWKDESQIGNPT